MADFSVANALALVARNAPPARVAPITLARSLDPARMTSGKDPVWSNGVLTTGANLPGTDWRSEAWMSTAGDRTEQEVYTDQQYYTVMTRGDVIDVRFDWKGTNIVGNGSQQSVIWQTHGPLGSRNGAWPGPALALSVHHSGTFRLGGGVASPNPDGSATYTDRSWYVGTQAPSMLANSGYPPFVNGTWYRHRILVHLDGPGVGSVSWWIDGSPIILGGKPFAGTYYVTDGFPARSHYFNGQKFGFYGGIGTNGTQITSAVTSEQRNISVVHTRAQDGRKTVYYGPMQQTFDELLTSGTTGQVLSKTGTNTMGWVAAASGGLPAGGATGQVLAKNSATDGDAGWVTPAGSGATVRKVLATAVTESAGTQTTITDLALPTTLATGKYRVRGHLRVRAAATTAGCQVGMQGHYAQAQPTVKVEVHSTGTSSSVRFLSSGSTSGQWANKTANTASIAANGDQLAIIEGVVDVTAAPATQIGPTINTSAAGTEVSVQPGSWFEYEKIS